MRALEELQSRILTNPNDALSHWKMGCFYGYLGEWNKAWSEMEWRTKLPGKMADRRKVFPTPTWEGQSGKVLIYQDQGFGDWLMYSRYITNDMVVYCESEMVNLMKLNFSNVVMWGDPIPKHDYVLPVCSLPNVFKEIVCPKLVGSSGKYKPKGKIGVAWAGNPDYHDDGTRSCKPDDMLILGDGLVSLMIQKGLFEDYSLRLGDFKDTSDLISSLDSVVSVDTAVAHLAASLGKKTYLALPYAHDWRWGVSSKMTPWYPSMRLVRQPKAGDWTSVFQQIKAELTGQT